MVATGRAATRVFKVGLTNESLIQWLELCRRVWARQPIKSLESFGILRQFSNLSVLAPDFWKLKICLDVCIFEKQ